LARRPRCFSLLAPLDGAGLFLGTHEVRLNPEVMTSDPAEFIGLQRAGKLEAALSSG
jgi:hypothetical protein